MEYDNKYDTGDQILDAQAFARDNLCLKGCGAYISRCDDKSCVLQSTCPTFDWVALEYYRAPTSYNNIMKIFMSVNNLRLEAQYREPTLCSDRDIDDADIPDTCKSYIRMTLAKLFGFAVSTERNGVAAWLLKNAEDVTERGDSDVNHMYPTPWQKKIIQAIKEQRGDDHVTGYDQQCISEDEYICAKFLHEPANFDWHDLAMIYLTGWRDLARLIGMALRDNGVIKLPEVQETEGKCDDNQINNNDHGSRCDSNDSLHRHKRLGRFANRRSKGRNEDVQ